MSHPPDRIGPAEPCSAWTSEDARPHVDHILITGENARAYMGTAGPISLLLPIYAPLWCILVLCQQQNKCAAV